MDSNISERPSALDPTEKWLDIVRKNVSQLHFGSVHIIVHDGRVTQVESIAKTRFVTSRDETFSGRK